MQLALIDCGSKGVPHLQSFIRSRELPQHLVQLDSANTFDFSKFDGAIISGGPHLFTDSEEGSALKSKFSFLKSFDLPVLGICLGHQALALAEGAEVFRGPESRSTEAISILVEHPLFEGLRDGVQMKEDHCEGVELPDSYSLLAKSESYAVEAMAHASLPRFGVQFHPEFSEQVGEKLLENFLNIVMQGEK